MIQFFRERLRKVKVLKKSQGKFVQGEWQQETSETVDTWMIPAPIPRTYLREQMEGEYTSQDRAFYQRAKLLFAKNDVILYDGKEYKIHDTASREDDVVTVYYCKLESEEGANVFADCH